MAARELVLATRGSALALAQARLVQRALAEHGAGVCRIVPVSSRGDEGAGGAAPLADLARAEPGVFTSALSAAVRDGRADAAVHSLKDLPVHDPDGLVVAAVLPRAPAADLLLIDPRRFAAAAPLGLPPGAAVGTGSPRRAALLRHYAPGVEVAALRGNVPTRVRRCRAGSVAAVVLARAGLERLAAAGDDPAHGLRRVVLPPEQWPPAPGQGAIAVQTRAHGPAAALLAALLAAIDHAPTRTAVTLERVALQAHGGGCGAGFGAYARAVSAESAAAAGRDSGWRLYFGFAGEADGAGSTDAAGWRAYTLEDSAAGCHRALAAWAAGGRVPGVPAAPAAVEHWTNEEA